LSSVNLEYFDEWKEDDNFIADLITMLDNTLEHFIDNAVDEHPQSPVDTLEGFMEYVEENKQGFARAAYSAYRERAVGLGAMGFHSYLQRSGLPFAGVYAASFNNRAFKLIKERAVDASKVLGRDRGEAPDMAGSGRRNSHLLAIAPNASSSIICGGTSPSIEPSRANIFTHKTLSGSYRVKNKYLEKLLEEKGINNEKTWKDISAAEGSVAGLTALSEEEKEVFKTAPEINQIWVIEHAYQRQPYVCQSQSVNTFFEPPPSNASQETHDEYLEYVNNVHWVGANKLKSMYYYRTTAARNAENVNVKIPRINLEDGECLSCEG
jgi:ribonucleoside-diphosphate reductase alpha chain